MNEQTKEETRLRECMTLLENVIEDGNRETVMGAELRRAWYIIQNFSEDMNSVSKLSPSESKEESQKELFSNLITWLRPWGNEILKPEWEENKWTLVAHLIRDWKIGHADRLSKDRFVIVSSESKPEIYLQCPRCLSKDIVTRIQPEPPHYCKECGYEFYPEESKPESKEELFTRREFELAYCFGIFGMEGCNVDKVAEGVNSERWKRVQKEISKLSSKEPEQSNPVLDLVNEQAEDDGLWFEAEYATEAYLQQELRKLHSAVEDYFTRKNQDQ